MIQKLLLQLRLKTEEEALIWIMSKTYFNPSAPQRTIEVIHLMERLQTVLACIFVNKFANNLVEL